MSQSTFSTSGSTTNLFSAQGAGFKSPPVSMQVPQINPGLLAFTVLTENSGSTFLLGAPAASRIITLPAVANCRGCAWRFVVTAVAAAAETWTITPATAVLQGAINTSAAGANSVVIKQNGASVVITATRLIGDRIDIESDGVNFYVSGSGQAAASFS